MTPDPLLPPVLAILFVATFIRSAFGFGEALVAVPLLALLIPVGTAVPLAILASVTVAAVIVLQDWRQVHFRSAALLVLASLAGVPLGLAVLAAAPEAAVKAGLGVVIIGFALYALTDRRPFELANDRWAWAFGFVAGVLGGAYGMNGPPLVIYGALRRWPPPQFRATLQGYFLPTSAVILVLYAVTGFWAVAVTWYFLWALPVPLLAVLLGRVANRRMDRERFLVYVYAGLILVGGALLFHAVGPSGHVDGNTR